MKPTYEELEDKTKVLSDRVETLEDTVRRKDERIAWLERQLFGSKRDKAPEPADPNAPTLFDDFFKDASVEQKKQLEETERKIAEEARQRRERKEKKSGRPTRYQYLGLEERERTVIPDGVDLSLYDIIGEDVSSILHRDKARFWVEKIKRPILRLKTERKAVRPKLIQAEPAKAVIPGNHVGADVLAQLVVDKFEHHIPEYRQSKMLRGQGVVLPTSTINDWIHAVADKLYPLYESLCEDIRSSDYVQADETVNRIADGKGKCRQAYCWQFRDARPDSHGLYFYYYKGSRAADIPKLQLRGYRGAVQADGCPSYDFLEKMDNVTLLGCMAHVRRKFTDAEKACPGVAAQGLRYIEMLYTMEANLKERKASEEQIRKERQEHAIPVMDAMEAWMQAVTLKTTPKDLLHKAAAYAMNLWPRLKRYTLDGRYMLDNNAVERGQRPMVMGRKNYLFSMNDKGAEDNALFYSLLESCDVVGLNPLDWLTDILPKIDDTMAEDDIVALLPYQYKKSRE